MLSRVLDPCAIVRVQGWEGAAGVPLAIEQVVGVAWPRQVGAVASGLVDVLCVGPTDWLVIGGDRDEGGLCGRLGAALVGSPFRATDVSQGLARVEFEGPEVREFLLKGCALDVRPDRFAAGRCARTRFAGMPVVFRRHDASRFEGLVAASYREYWLAWIADARDLVPAHELTGFSGV